jgi:hypothetical protein
LIRKSVCISEEHTSVQQIPYRTAIPSVYISVAYINVQAGSANKKNYDYIIEHVDIPSKFAV